MHKTIKDTLTLIDSVMDANTGDKDYALRHDNCCASLYVSAAL